MVSLVRHAAKVANQHFIRSNVTIAAGLALVLGLGWGFGLAASSNKINDLACTLQIIFSIFVGSQGLLLLLFHGVRNKDAKKVWRSWLPFVKSGRGIHEKASSQGENQFNSTLQGISVPAPQSESVYDQLTVSHFMGDGTFVKVIAPNITSMLQQSQVESKSQKVEMIKGFGREELAESDIENI